MNSEAFIACTAFTLVVYAASRMLNARLPSPLTNPVVTSTLCIIVALCATGVEYPVYRGGTELITLLLGPATVALAVPLYKHRAVLAACAPAAVTGMACGGLATVLAAIVICGALGLQADLTAAMSIKSATAPIAVQVAPLVNADPSIAAVFAIGTGMSGAVLGPWILNICSVRDPFCRGLAYGSISHGIGTVQATAEGELQGAVSAAAMSASAVLVAISVPRLLPMLT
jgi:putative effector of murein hydrolase